jgi:hypothetical protein
MASPTLRKTLKNEILGLNLIFITIVAFIYYSFSALLINYKLVLIALFERNDLSYKLNIIWQLIRGSYYALGFSDFILLTITSILVSINLMFVIKLITNLKKSKGKYTLSLGGSSVLAVLVAGGCSCGFSVLSILGLAGVVSLLPFGSLGIHLFVVGLLLFSIFFSANTYHKEVVCKVKRR